MKRMSGLTLLDEREGAGAPAQKGDRVVYNTRMFLNQGDEVPLNNVQATRLPRDMVRVEAGITFVDHTIVLGRRRAIAEVEHVLMGMKAGGYRKVRMSSQVGYRDTGIPELIPSNAVLVVEIWLRAIAQERRAPASCAYEHFAPCPSSPNCVSTHPRDEGHAILPFRFPHRLRRSGRQS
jgi:FKBP-type peptidyl-prolyl isomerase-like protein